MIRFILNNQTVNTELPPGTVLLDFIRYHKNLKGTKIGCREGDCGACTVLLGELKGDDVVYRSVTSCLHALGNTNGKHVVTVEGINQDKLTPVQEAFCETNGTQCGFCTPGFIVSLTGFCISQKEPTYTNAIASVDGNICRCTGYKSIERATEKITALVNNRNGDSPLNYAISTGVIPAYFTGIKNRLIDIATVTNGQLPKTGGKLLGGGTDLYVQQHEQMVASDIKFIWDKKNLKDIWIEQGQCVIGGAATVSDLLNATVIQQSFPRINKFIKLVSSTPIRNMATIAGNFVNASPIGDLTIFFLALNAQITLTNGETKRQVPLRNFYKGYKQLDKLEDEYIEQVSFALPTTSQFFNFEKVSKRTHLDIASVNTAISIELYDRTITKASISAGGVGPVPMYLSQASAWLEGKQLNEDLFVPLLEIVQSEIVPISDARGSATYKRLLLNQLIKAHFITLFPQLPAEKIIAAAL